MRRRVGLPKLTQRLCDALTPRTGGLFRPPEALRGVEGGRAVFIRPRALPLRGDLLRASAAVDLAHLPAGIPGQGEEMQIKRNRFLWASGWWPWLKSSPATGCLQPFTAAQGLGSSATLSEPGHPMKDSEGPPPAPPTRPPVSPGQKCHSLFAMPKTTNTCPSSALVVARMIAVGSHYRRGVLPLAE